MSGTRETLDEPANVADARHGILAVEHLDLRIGPARLLSDVSFTVAAGEAVGLVGESGSGKTMTALTIMRLQPREAAVHGHVWFEGRDLLGASRAELRQIRGGELSMVFQEPRTSLNPSLTIGRQMVDVIRAHEQVSKAAARERAADLLGQVGLPTPRQLLGKYAYELSGGMCQRAMISMALACEPKLLIADEPTTALDLTIQAQVLELLASLAEQKAFSLLVITHDLGVVSELCDRVITLYAGEVVNDVPRTPLLREPTHPYTWQLLNAAKQGSQPATATSNEPASSGQGQPERAASELEGCRYHPRCPFAIDQCRREHPELVAHPPGFTRCWRAAELELPGEGGS